MKPKTMTVEDWLGKDNQLGIDIWNKKYRYGDETFEEWLDRVSGGDNDVKQLIIEKKFLFGGRILANRGLDKKGVKVTLSNCYVLAPPEDSIESIFDTASKMARTFSYGGGVGIDLSKLAPRGAKINNTAEETSGAVSFTDLYSLVTGLIGQHGRRGALMLSMSCEHPDIEEFVRVKTDLDRVTKANMSLRVTDKFMNAVVNGETVKLTFDRPETNDTITKELNAEKFFNEFCDINYDYGEPGCLFWDRITSFNMLSEYDNFEYAGTNPCGEVPLPAGGSCLLGSLNLVAFVKNGKFQYDEFRDAVRIAVRALNDVLDEGQPLHPLEEQRNTVKNWRQIGLGIMGLADMLIKLEIPYNSSDARRKSSIIGYEMMITAIEESCRLAKEYGCFPMCNGDKICESEFISGFGEEPEEFFENIREYGLRNSQLLSIAPTGTISTMLGVSGGIEPIFAKSYTRVTKSLDGEKEYKVYTPIVKEYMEAYNITDESKLPSYFVTAQEIDCMDRVKMQAAWQENVDSSISSTVNIPEDFPKEQVRDIYIQAWASGCKGITVFRDGCERDSILTTKEEKKVEPTSDDLIGKKRKLITGCGSLHCTAFFAPDDGRLLEVYLSKGSTGGCNNFMVGLSRMISLAARGGCSIEEIIDQLKSCGSCPSYAVRTATKKDTSKGSCCPMAVAWGILDMYNEMQGQIRGTPITCEKPKEIKNPCPKCGEELDFSGGCNVCKSCGWSRCD